MSPRHDPQAHAIVMAALNVRESIAAEDSMASRTGSVTDHRIMVGRERAQWPELWEAIDRLIAATKGQRP